MNLITWKPQTNLEQWMDAETFFGPRFLEQTFPEANASRPRVSVVEKNEEFTVTAEVPGLRKEDIDIEFHEGRLILKGESKHEQDKNVSKDQETYLYREISHRRFERSFRLGEGLDLDNVKANLEHGILTVHIPKKEEAKPRKIKVT